MSNDYRDSKFKSWLDTLQQESWQLELIISGFAIYGLFSIYEPLRLYFLESVDEQNIYATILSAVALIASSILLFNLLIHVVLRALWIGALGLRYVSGDIEFDDLKYRPKFDRFLRRRIISFDRYIGSLEKYCSVLFAVSFLLVFYFLSFILLVLCIVFTAVFIISGTDGEVVGGLRTGIGAAMVIFILIGGFLTFLDFVTQGFMKRNKWIAKIYYPVYRVFSLLTLSFLYRPIVYNFLDNKFGKRLLWLLVPAYSLIIFLVTLEYRESNFMALEQSSKSYFADYRNYEDQITEKSNLPRIATITSRVIDEPYVKVFVLNYETVENYLVKMNPSLKAEVDLRGLGSNIQIGRSRQSPFAEGINIDSLRRSYVETFNNNYRIKIDSLEMPASFIVSSNEREQLGFESYINIKNLADGKHLLKVQRVFLKEQDTLMDTQITIPFWYFQ